MKSLFLLISTTVFFLVPLVAQSATYYVAKTGSNANSCAQAQFQSTPKLTVGGGLGCMNGSDTLYVKAGIYNESINHDQLVSGSVGNPTTVSTFEDDVVTLFPLNRGGGGGDVVWFNRKSYITLRGFIIDASNVQWNGIRFVTAHHILVKNSEIKNAPYGNCIGVLNQPSHHLEFDNIKVHNCAKQASHPTPHGIYIYASDVTVKNSEIYDNNGYGVHIYYQNGSTGGRHKIYGNKVYDNGGVGILIGSGNDNLAYNNIVWNNARGGTGGTGGIVIGFRNPQNNQVYNNTLYQNGGPGILVRDGTNNLVKNNILWQNDIDIVIDNGWGSAISNNLGTNPDFVNENIKNFKLDVGSPAIDGGTAVTIVAEDIVGIQRPQQAKYDIGAYEFSGPGAPNNTPLLPPSNLRLASF